MFPRFIHSPASRSQATPRRTTLDGSSLCQIKRVLEQLLRVGPFSKRNKALALPAIAMVEVSSSGGERTN
jgi:hypothetical protein